MAESVKKGRQAQLPRLAPSLQRITLYYGANYIYLFGADNADGHKYKVLRIDRNQGDKIALRQVGCDRPWPLAWLDPSRVTDLATS
jgi:hypothetical protein